MASKHLCSSHSLNNSHSHFFEASLMLTDLLDNLTQNNDTKYPHQQGSNTITSNMAKAQEPDDMESSKCEQVSLKNNQRDKPRIYETIIPNVFSRFDVCLVLNISFCP